MYVRSASIVHLGLPLLASGAAFRSGGVLLSGSCDPEDLLCCHSSHPSTSSTANTIMKLLAVNANSVNDVVGVNCRPMTVSSDSGTSCDSEPLCCSDNSFRGLVAFGCAPFNL